MRDGGTIIVERRLVSILAVLCNLFLFTRDEMGKDGRVES